MIKVHVSPDEEIGGGLYIKGDQPDWEALAGDLRECNDIETHAEAHGDYVYDRMSRTLFLTGPMLALWTWDGTTAA